jgi:hypothetical protein
MINNKRYCGVALGVDKCFSSQRMTRVPDATIFERRRPVSRIAASVTGPRGVCRLLPNQI